ncbi:MAG TPA: hypothetical protein VH481_03990, partial [Nitrososphaeraceae archaeon]
MFTPPIWSLLSVSVLGGNTTANHRTLEGQLLFYANQTRPTRLYYLDYSYASFCNSALISSFSSSILYWIFSNIVNNTICYQHRLVLSSARSDLDKNYCCDKVGDGHFCFDKAKMQAWA